MQITRVALAILILFGVITLIQLVYYYVIYGRFAFHRKKSALGFRDIPVSVVIVVRDDAALAVQNLPLLLEQQYSSYEIVIVNDRSRDENSLQAIREYKDRFPNIKLVDLSTAVSTSRGKKMAISMGVKCATYDHILLTSPDCKPASRLWLSKMAQNFQFQQRIVLGYNTFEKKKGIYSHFLHFDNLISAVQYFAHALMHSTYRGRRLTTSIKILLVLLFCIVSCAALHFIQYYRVSQVDTGLPDLIRPVQGIRFLRDFPIYMPIWAYLMLWFLARIAAACVLGLVISVVSRRCSDVTTAVGVSCFLMILLIAFGALVPAAWWLSPIQLLNAGYF